MQGPIPGISEQEYDLPGVPWTMYFTIDGGELKGELEKTCNRLRQYPAKQIAVGVGTPERFEASHHAGCDLCHRWQLGN